MRSGGAPLVGAVVGVVLAGGQSTRLGRDKALLQLDGMSLVARAAASLTGVVGTVVVADAGRGYLAGLPSVADGPGRGPVAGLLGAAAAYPGRPLLALACDLPRLPASLLIELVGLAHHDLAWPCGPAGLEPLVALYGPVALAALARQVAAGRFALHGLARAAGLDVVTLTGEQLARHGDPGRIFLNLNREEDVARLPELAPP